MPTPSSSRELRLPWETGRTFRVFGYGAGHSQLLLREAGEAGADRLNLLFEGVEFMKLRIKYPLATLRPASAEEAAEMGSLPERPWLKLAIVSTEGVGLIACGRVTVRRPSVSAHDLYGGEVLMYATAFGS